MTSRTDGIFVTSHVSRDLLQSAALFKNEHLVVWEYVSNGLQYGDGRTPPVVRVRLDEAKKKISIKDNGRGMNSTGLKNFFVMHGENVDRKAGRAGRGMFGTGKSAAFGIARTLILTTEPPRGSRRLHWLRGWSHGTKEQTPGRGAGASGAVGVRAVGGARVAVGGDHRDRAEVGLHA